MSSTNTSAEYRNGVGAHRADGPDGSLADLYSTDEEAGWKARARVVLTPIAAPSVLGLFGFMAATTMLGSWQAGWYGSAITPALIFPFAIAAGGLAQFVAGMFAYRARDALATAVHGIWGAFWIGWGLMQILTITGDLPAIGPGTTSPSFAFWFIVLTMITGSAALASLPQGLGVFATLSTLTAGSALTAAGFWGGFLYVTRAGGWLFVASAAIAWLTATAMMMESSYGRTIIPLGKPSKDANVPGRMPTHPIQYREGMPGSKVGQ